MPRDGAHPLPRHTRRPRSSRVSDPPRGKPDCPCRRVSDLHPPAPTDVARPATRALAPHALARAGCACAVAALVMAVLVLLGWTADIPSLRVLRTGWVSMKPNSALCLMLAALGLMSAASQRFRAGGCLAVAALALVAGATGLQYLLNVDLRIDELLVIDALGDTLHPGRMAQVTVLNF